MSSQRFNASDLGLTVGRTTTLPATVGGLVSGLRDNVSNWVRLASGPRTDGGEITAAARTAARFASALTDNHGADADAVAASIRTRSILRDSDAVVIASYFPAIYTVDDNGELARIDTPADDAPDSDAPTDDDAPDAPDNA
jgi:hypothetical protein